MYAHLTMPGVAITKSPVLVSPLFLVTPSLAVLVTPSPALPAMESPKTWVEVSLTSSVGVSPASPATALAGVFRVMEWHQAPEMVIAFHLR